MRKDEEDAQKEILELGLSRDIFGRMQRVWKEKKVGERVKELKTKLAHFKDFELIRETLTKFYQNKLSKQD